MDNRNKRILVTLIILIIYWMIGYIPVPGIDARSLVNNFSPKLTILALGLMPYISANIIILLLSVIFPYFQNIVHKEGLNSAKINKAVIGTTLMLSVIQSIFISLWMKNSANAGTIPSISLPINIVLFVAPLTITLGVFLLLWLGHLISKYGVGNGISLLILLPLVVRGVKNLISIQTHFGQSFLVALGFIIFLAAVIKYFLGIKEGFNVKGVDTDEDSISMGIPLSLSGIVPLTFATSIILFPTTLASLGSDSLFNKAASFLQNTNPIVGWTIFAVLVVFFTYFTVAIVFNPVKWADRMKQVGLVVPNVETGRPTAEYMNALMTRFMIKWAGFLVGICLLWRFFPYRIRIPHFEFGVKSLLLIIGICLAVGKSLFLRFPQREVYRHNDFGEVLIINALLKTKGIDCIVENVESYAKFVPLVVGSLGEKRILVKEDDYNKAKEIISAI